MITDTGAFDKEQWCLALMRSGRPAQEVAIGVMVASIADANGEGASCADHRVASRLWCARKRVVTLLERLREAEWLERSPEPRDVMDSHRLTWPTP